MRERDCGKNCANDMQSGRTTAEGHRVRVRDSTQRARLKSTATVVSIGRRDGPAARIESLQSDSPPAAADHVGLRLGHPLGVERLVQVRHRS